MIKTAHLFPLLHDKLISLLQSLSAEDWDRPTIAGSWTAKDVAAHLLDVNLRTLSALDGHRPKPDRDIHSYQDLVAYLNHLNGEWVAAAKRISPQILTELLDVTGRRHSDYMATLDPYAEAPFSVAWAGEEKSVMWFHVAREFTEKWHHQQQIRDAVGKPGIMTRELFYPCIDTFMCGLPHTYRDTVVVQATAVRITITTDIGGDWFLIYDGMHWRLASEVRTTPASTVTIDPDTAWKLFTKGLSPEAARQKVLLDGDKALAGVVLKLVAVMA